MTIYVTWLLANIISLLTVAGLRFAQGIPPKNLNPAWKLIRRTSHTALQHHALNLVLQGPGMILPIMVTALLSASMNASFYIAWMIISMVSAGTVALGTVLQAVGSGNPVALSHKIRFTLRMSVFSWFLPFVALAIAGDFILRLFGPSYAEQANTALLLLTLSVLPSIIKTHYVALARVNGRLWSAIVLCTLGAFLELIFASIGIRIGNSLTGLSLGYLVAVLIEAVILLPPVFHAVVHPTAQHQVCSNSTI